MKRAGRLAVPLAAALAGVLAFPAAAWASDFAPLAYAILAITIVAALAIAIVIAGLGARFSTERRGRRFLRTLLVGFPVVLLVVYTFRMGLLTLLGIAFTPFTTWREPASLRSKIRDAKCVLRVEYLWQDDGWSADIVVVEALKAAPSGGPLCRYKVGAVVRRRAPRRPQGSGDVYFFFGPLDDQWFIYPYMDGRIRDLGDITVDELRAKIAEVAGKR